MEEDGLIRWVRCRAVYLASQTFARQVAILAEEFSTLRFGKAFEVSDGPHIETAKQKRTVLEQSLVDIPAVALRPIREIEVFYFRLDHEWSD